MSGERAERRAYPRYSVPDTAELIVAVAALGTGTQQGVVQDISRSGLKARFTQAALEAADRECLVRFLNVGDELEPRSTLGVVPRVETSSGYSLVAIEFVEPLEFLKVPAAQRDA